MKAVNVASLSWPSQQTRGLPLASMPSTDQNRPKSGVRKASFHSQTLSANGGHLTATSLDKASHSRMRQLTTVQPAAQLAGRIATKPLVTPFLTYTETISFRPTISTTQKKREIRDSQSSLPKDCCSTRKHSWILLFPRAHAHSVPPLL